MARRLRGLASIGSLEDRRPAGRWHHRSAVVVHTVGVPRSARFLAAVVLVLSAAAACSSDDGRELPPPDPATNTSTSTTATTIPPPAIDTSDSTDRQSGGSGTRGTERKKQVGRRSIKKQ